MTEEFFVQTLTSITTLDAYTFLTESLQVKASRWNLVANGSILSQKTLLTFYTFMQQHQQWVSTHRKLVGNAITVLQRRSQHAWSEEIKKIADLFMQAQASLPNTDKQEITDEQGRTPLFLAIQERNIPEVIRLLKVGYAINHKDKQGHTPLSLAIDQINSEQPYKAQDYQLVQLLLDHGADPMQDKIYTKGISKSDVKLTQILLKYIQLLPRDLQMEATDALLRELSHLFKSIFYEQKGAFMKDALTVQTHQERFTEIVKLLLTTHGGYLKVTIFYICHKAIKYNQIEILKLCFAHDRSCLAIMCQNLASNRIFYAETNEATLHLCLSHEPQVWPFFLQMILFNLNSQERCRVLAHCASLTDQAGNTPLHFALQRDLIDSPKVQDFIQAGVPLNVKNQKGETAFDIAVQLKLFEVTRLLCKNGVTGNLKQTPLHLAVQSNNLEEIDALLQAGADLFERDALRYNSLDYAVATRQITTVRQLFKSEEPYEIILYTHDPNPCVAAAANGDLEILQLLMHKLNYQPSDSSFDYDDELAVSVKNGHSAVVEWLLEHTSLDGTLATHVACQKNDVALLKMIFTHRQSATLVKAIDPRQRQDLIYTPLLTACKHGSFEAVQYLLALSPSIYQPPQNIDPHNPAFVLLQLFRLSFSKAKTLDPQYIPHLYLAVESNNPQLVQLIAQQTIKCRADVYEKQLYCLNHAIRHGYLESAEVLFDTFPQDLLRSIPSPYETPLHAAAEAGHFTWVQRLVAKGCPLNGILQEQAQMTKTPLSCAASQGHAAIVQFLLESGAKLFVQDPTGNWTHQSCIEQALHSGSQPVFRLLWEASKQQEENVLHSFTKCFSFHLKAEHNVQLLRFLFTHIKGFSEQEAEEVIAKLLSISFKKAYYEIKANMAIFRHGFRLHHTPEAWLNYLREVELFITTLQTNKQLTYTNFSKEKTVQWVVEEIFAHIFEGMNPTLGQQPNVLMRMSSLFSSLTAEEDLSACLLALQTCPVLEEALTATEYAIFRRKLEVDPPPSFFSYRGDARPAATSLIIFINKQNQLFWHEKERQLLFPEQQSTHALLEHQKNWLTYYSVYRSRKGLLYSLHILKQQTTSPDLQLKALQILENVGISHWNKKQRNKFHHYLELLLLKTSDSRVKQHLCRTLWAIDPSPHHEKLKIFFDKILQEELSKPKGEEDIPLVLSVVELLGHFLYSPHPFNERVLNDLISLLTHTDPRIRRQTAFTLSKIPHEKGLLALLAVVKSSDWQEQDQHYGLDQISKMGDFTLFRSRPGDIHDNRHALLQRVMHQLVVLHQEKESFQHQIEERWKTYRKTPQVYPTVMEIEKKFHQLSSTCCRYVGLPLFFPENTVVARGISNRKGDTKFYGALLDLFRKGCGSSDLSEEGDPLVDGATWNKIGHIFGSHNFSLFLEKENAYFNGEESALILVNAAYYNREYLRGEARLEKEGTFNTVFYRGIPRHEIQALYLNKKLKPDIQLLVNTPNLKQVQKRLTTPLFKNCSLKELAQIKRQLLAQDDVQIKGKIQSLSLIERIHYCHQVKDENPTLLSQAEEFFKQEEEKPLTAKRLAQQGFHFSSEQEVLSETLKRAIGKEMIQEKYQCTHGKDIFMGQDQMLSDFNDSEFALYQDGFFHMMNPEIQDMQRKFNNHGRKLTADRQVVPVTILEHTQEVIAGRQGGLGLNTSFSSQMPLPYQRKILRLAALFHDIGKLADAPLADHIQHSVEKASVILKNYPRFYGITLRDIPLILTLIQHNDIFGRYTHPRSSLTLSVVKDTLVNLHTCLQQQKIEITYPEFCQLLLSLYLADASTLKAVQKHKAFYQDLQSQLSSLNYEDLAWLEELKLKLHFKVA